MGSGRVVVPSAVALSLVWLLVVFVLVLDSPDAVAAMSIPAWAITLFLWAAGIGAILGVVNTVVLAITQGAAWADRRRRQREQGEGYSFRFEDGSTSSIIPVGEMVQRRLRLTPLVRTQIKQARVSPQKHGFTWRGWRPGRERRSDRNGPVRVLCVRQITPAVPAPSHTEDDKRNGRWVYWDGEPLQLEGGENLILEIGITASEKVTREIGFSPTSAEGRKYVHGQIKARDTQQDSADQA